MTMYQNQSKQVMKIRLPYYGTNKCESTEFFLRINRDTIIRQNNKGTCMVIDAAFPGDRRVIKKEAEKILKYKDPIIENQNMWNMKEKLTSVTIWATGTFPESLRKYLSNIR